MYDNTCVFCRIYSGKSNNFYDKILFETNNFFVIPALGQFVEGYLLIVSKSHYSCMGKTDPYNFFELVKFKKQIFEILNKHYRKPLFFEHGPVLSCEKAGCCIDHAHFHVIPCDISIEVLTPLILNWPSKLIDKIEQLSEQVERGESYIFFESQSNEKFVVKVPELESQYMRKLIANKVGMFEFWNWRKYPFEENISRTIKKLATSELNLN